MKKTTERDIDEAVARIRALNPDQALLGRLCQQEAARLGVRTRVLVRRFPTVTAVWDDNKQASVGLVPEGMSGGLRVERGQRKVAIPVTGENHRNLKDRWAKLGAPTPPPAPEPIDDAEEVPEVASDAPEPVKRPRMVGGGAMLALMLAATAGGSDVDHP